MILPEMLPDLERLAPYYATPMLMLGAQSCHLATGETAHEFFAQWLDEPVFYHELDLDGGDMQLNLNEDLAQLAGFYRTVFNLGTIEHVWDAHRAWSNALRAVKPGGYFLSHTPVDGWRDETGAVNHGIHQTRPAAIEAFIRKNGFVIVDQWRTRFGERGNILWLVARKVRHLQSLADFQPVMQVYQAGKIGDAV